MNDFYFSLVQGAPLSRPFTHTVGEPAAVYNSSFKYLPSESNKQYCQSTVGKISAEIYEPCTLEIESYISTVVTENSICVTISQIPPSVFPNYFTPAGYRIYHNFGEQKTIAFDSYSSTNDDLVFPYTFCLSKCDMLYLLGIGRKNINIAIDFYDTEGRILNNPGCDTLNFSINIPFQFCDLFEFKTERTAINGECCIYNVTLKVIGCQGTENIRFIDFLAGLKFSNFKKNSPLTLVGNIPGVNFDFINGIITFPYSACKDDIAKNNNFFEFYFDDNFNPICSHEPVNFEPCSCNCPAPPEDINTWLKIEPELGTVGSDCDENHCKIKAVLNIPAYYNCFKFFSIDAETGYSPVPEDGNLFTGGHSSYSCINKGDYVNYTVKLYRFAGDPNPCIIESHAFCPLETIYKGCDPTPQCDNEWIEDYITRDVPGCPDCKYSVNYRYRENSCANNIQEIQMLMLKTIGTGCSVCNLNIQDIHNEALKRVISENQMGFQPLTGEENGNCYTIWRVILTSCWTEYELPIEVAFSYDGGPAVVFSPCEGTECCMLGLKVCRFTDYMTFETFDEISGSDICSTLTKTVVDPVGFGTGYYDPTIGDYRFYKTMEVPCFNRCIDFFSLDDDNYVRKESIFDTGNKYRQEDKDIKIYSIQKNEILNTVVFCNTDCSQLNMKIYSTEGRLLSTNEFSIKHGINEFQITLNNLTSGVYLIHYSVDGIYKFSKKLIIIK